MTMYYLLIDAKIRDDGSFMLYDVLSYSKKHNRDAAKVLGSYELNIEIDEVAIAVKDRLLGRNTQLRNLIVAAASNHIQRLATSRSVIACRGETLSA